MPTPNLDDVDRQRRRTLLIAGVLSLVVVLIGVGVALALLANRPVTSKPPITPAEETSASATGSAAASASVVASASAEASVTSSTATSSTASTTTVQPGQIVRAGKIAYRLGNQIWVANEDGSSAKAVFSSSTGAYALSPDGKTVALSDVREPSLHGPIRLFDAESGEQFMTLECGENCASILAFSPDGTKLLAGFHRGSARIWDVRR